MNEQQLPPATYSKVFESDKATIWTYTSPEAFLSNSTHIIETENGLVIIDGQFVVPFATEFRNHIDEFGKPILRVYLSHDHPDHWFGMGAIFTDEKIYALPQTIDFLKSSGEAIRAERAKEYGPFVPEKVVIPTNEIQSDSESVDGLLYEYVVHQHTETEFHLSIRLPELGVFIVQDLVYTHAHIYLTPYFDKWIEALNTVANEEGIDLYLAGHGSAASSEDLHANAEYLAYAKELVERESSAEELKKALIEKYPERTGAAVLDISIPRLLANQENQ